MPFENSSLALGLMNSQARCLLLSAMSLAGSTVSMEALGEYAIEEGGTVPPFHRTPVWYKYPHAQIF